MVDGKLFKIDIFYEDIISGGYMIVQKLEK